MSAQKGDREVSVHSYGARQAGDVAMLKFLLGRMLPKERSVRV